MKDLYKIAINGLKRKVDSFIIIAQCIYILLDAAGLEIEIKSGEGGPDRFSAEFRIKKSQVQY